MAWQSWRARFTREALGRSFSALRVADYRHWSFAQLLSGSGGAAAQIAMAWVVVLLGGDGVALGAVTACMMLPTLLLGPVIGGVVDRYPRATVLLVTAVAQMVVTATIAALLFAGALQLWMLLALALAHGVAFAVDNPARQLLVMDLVGRARITGAISMNEVIINGSRVVGPAVAGALLAVATPAWCFVFGVASFVPSLVVLWRLRRRLPGAASARQATEPLPDASVPMRPWAFVRSTPPVRATLLLAVCSAAAFNIAVVVPLIVADVFQADGSVYGALAVAFGLGALPGAVFSATGPITPHGEEVRVLALVMAIAVLASAAAPSPLWLGAGLAVLGAAVMWFIARANALVMLSSPEAIRGRVMAIWAMAMPGSTVITGMLVGLAADLIGPRWAFATVGVGTLLILAFCWTSLRSRDAAAQADLPR